MNSTEALRLAKKLGSLFQPLTQEQSKMAIREFAAYSAAAVDHAIHEHRVSGGTREGFIDWRQLFEGCRAAEAGESRAPREVPCPSFADVIRGQWAQVRDRGDYEVLLRYWRGDWWRYEPRYRTRRDGLETQRAHLSPEAFAEAVRRLDEQCDGYRAKCETGAANSLIAAGVDPDGARIAAAAILDPPEVFRLVLEDLRQTQAGPATEPALPM